VEKDWSRGTRSSRRIHGWPWEEEGMAGGGVPTAAEARRGGARRRGGSRRGGWLSSGLTAAARRGEAVGVVELGGGGAEVRARRRQELTGGKGIDGEVVPVEVRPRGVAWECQWGAGKLPRGL
jgi:hypothetical protein